MLNQDQKVLATQLVFRYQSDNKKKRMLETVVRVFYHKCHPKLVLDCLISLFCNSSPITVFLFNSAMLSMIR